MKIPKIFHHIWLGDEPMPPQMVTWRRTWGELHPDFEMWLWQNGLGTRGHDHDFVIMQTSLGVRRIFATRYPDLVSRSCHLSQISNIFRYEILNDYGGIYLDTDMEPSRNLTPLIDDVECFAGFGETKTRDGMVVTVENAIFGTTPDSLLTKGLVSRLPERDPSVHTSLGVGFFQEVARDIPNMRIFQPHVFHYRIQSDHYPWGSTSDTLSCYHPDAYAYHRRSSRWFKGSCKLLNRE